MDSDYTELKQELARDWRQARRATERAQQELEQARAAVDTQVMT